jgi:hypothetical protein
MPKSVVKARWKRYLEALPTSMRESARASEKVCRARCWQGQLSDDPLLHHSIKRLPTVLSCLDRRR